jgi:hypothetical protein
VTINYTRCIQATCLTSLAVPVARGRNKIRASRDVEPADLGQGAVRVYHVLCRAVGERAEERVFRDRRLVIQVVKRERKELREAVHGRVRVPAEPEFYELDVSFGRGRGVARVPVR